MKKALIALLIFVLIFGGIYIFNHRKKVKSDELILYGNIEIRQVDLSFRVEGKIAKMLAEEGDSVKKGQLLGYLEDTKYRSIYEKDLANIEALKAVTKNAEAQYIRNIPLCLDGTTSQQECDSLQNTKDTSRASLDAAIASCKGAKKDLNDTKLLAPADGIIMTRVQEPGAVVEPSNPIYTMAKTKPVWVRAYIPEPNLANVKYGMEAKVLTDTISPKTGKKREYIGQVGYISPVAEFTPKTVQTTNLRTDLVYRIRVYIYDIDEFLRQGMPVTVKIKLENGDIKNNDTKH